MGYRVAYRKKLKDIPKGHPYVNWKEFLINDKKDNKNKKASYVPDMPSAIVYTGGTTGKSKGTVLSNDACNIMTVLYKNSNTRVCVGDSMLGIMPPFIAYGFVCGIINPLNLGMRIIYKNNEVI